MDHKLNTEGICRRNMRPKRRPSQNSAKAGRAVLQGEEFDDSTATVVRKKQKKMPLTDDIRDKGGDLMDSLSAKGLCLNCADAPICKFQGFGDDVVFCEEHSSTFDNESKDRLFHKPFADVPCFGVSKLIQGWDS